MKKLKTVVIIPAFNAGETINKVCEGISGKLVSDIIVVNDGSTDNTLELLKKLKVTYLSHSYNRGYGASQKTAYKFALKLKADIIIMLHADGQHDPKYIKNFLKIIGKKYDLILGSRIKNFPDALKNGMPFYKVLFNRLLSLLENLILGLNLEEYHTGYRAFTGKVLEKVNFEKFSDDFIFDQQILFSARLHNFRIGEIYTSCIYNNQASSINLFRSFKYGLGVLENLFLYIFDKKRFW